MSERPTGARSRPALVGVAFVVGTAALLTAWLWPRPTAPWGPPGMPPEPDARREAMARDATLAAAAPTGDDVDALLALDRARGRDEGTPRPDATMERRRRDVLSTLARIVRAEGDGALDALRAAAVLRFDAVLRGEASAEDRAWILGRFPEVMARYGAMTPEGDAIAPRFVLRTMYAARWNVAHGLDPVRGLGPAALRAYHGWLAFEVEGAPPAQRLAALDAYEAAGGEAPPGARAALLALAGRWAEAGDAYVEAYQATGSIRFRNHALHAVARAAGE